MGAITTPDAVAALTGKTVTAEDIATASGILEAVTGTDLTTEPLSYTTRDVRALRRAVSWQARYLADHPDLLSREGNLTGASTNGVSLSWGEGGSAASLVAPLARMALRGLSWRRSKTLRMVKGRPVPSMREGGPQTLTSDGSDGAWTPLR